MAVSQVVLPIEFAYSSDGSQPQVLSGQLEANSQTFVAGDLVYLASGAVTENANDDTLVMGIALDDATNVTSGNAAIRIQVIEPHHVYAMNVTNAGSDTTTAIATVGVKYALYTTSAGVWQADTGDAGHDCFVVVGIEGGVGRFYDSTAVTYYMAQKAIGDTNGRVYVRFLYSACQSWAGA